MYKLSQTAQEALDTYWLYVWHSLVEQYWDFILNKQHNPYTFSSMRQNGNKQVDEAVASLANSFWERNRFDLKECFVNYTCDFWPDKRCAIHKDVDCGGWIDCGADPVYPDRRDMENACDAPHLARTGQLQKLLKKAECNAFLALRKDAIARKCAKKHRRAKARWQLFKAKAKKLFKKLLLELQFLHGK